MMPAIIHNREYFHLFIRIFDLIYMLALVFTYCNCAYNVADECTDGMVKIILKLESPLLNDTTYECKINMFLLTVNEFGPAVNLAGFFNINRILFGSIVSVLITYLVIIIQLKSSVE
uniref:Gustatory receptor 2 n=1 Tax=Drosicha corpulenta TaxID=535978 RepID=A0A0U3T5P4_9HEMI|nr:gustatory receptor 2 [Drosicha corpulenta]